MKAHQTSNGACPRFQIVCTLLAKWAIDDNGNYMTFLKMVYR
jgi:hypothetical protein